jgi:superfamily II RNA helicase
MVFICPSIYPKENNIYEKKFNCFNYELDHFQKWAIEGIEKQKNILVTAHTGSGKSTPFEYCIKKYCYDGKKVIYTSPIKSLSNQKYYELKQKHPELSVGILTGDIKFNPEADVLIMTTEILRNTLFLKEEIKLLEQNIEGNNIDELDKIKSTLQFNIDMETELACVVFDEVHYINDKDRGKVWEETIMSLPKNIQMVMLSATIDKSVEFAKWIETIKDKEVYLASTNIRVIPLTHYIYDVYNKSLLDKVETIDKSIYNKMKQTNNKFIALRENNGLFHIDNYDTLNEIHKFMYKNHINNPGISYILNSLVNKLKEENKLPGLCFSFSRKKVEEYSKLIENSLFDEEESKKSSLVEKECKNILMKLPNYKEYTDLVEYRNIINLLKKGVAIHHSGVLPVFKEMIELLFSKGYIKLLFATETFAVGINMPTKTVIFSGLKKYDGIDNRYLYSHEYTQMAGRAGRRGLDKIGNVIHLTNMFNIPKNYEYKNILSGLPQTLISKFTINSSLLLQIWKSIDNMGCCEENIEKVIIDYITKSMSNNELTVIINNELNELKNLEDELVIKEKGLLCLKTELETIKKYYDLKNVIEYKNGKKKRQLEKQLIELENNSSKSFNTDYKYYLEYVKSQNEVLKYRKQLEISKEYYNIKIRNVLEILINNEFIKKNSIHYCLTEKGQISTYINEINSLVFSELYNSGYLNKLKTEEIIMYLSTYSGLKVKDDYKVKNINSIEYINNYSTYLKDLLECQEKYNIKYLNEELKYNIEVRKEDYEICYDLIDLMFKWYNANDEESCKLVIKELENKDIFIGEFVKALLKINNIVLELEKICIINENLQLRKNIENIRDKTMKYIVTNQSLYV